MKYPLFLELAGQPVVVIGGGKVALRKIKTLLAADAIIKVVSPAAVKPIQEFAGAKRLRWIKRRYRQGDLAGAWLVIAATDDLTVNTRISTDARKRKLLVNCIAPPAAGNFIVPAQIQRGNLTLAISTGGASPAFAKGLRRDLERFLDGGYATLLKEMSAARRLRKKAK